MFPRRILVAAVAVRFVDWHPAVRRGVRVVGVHATNEEEGSVPGGATDAVEQKSPIDAVTKTKGLRSLVKVDAVPTTNEHRDLSSPVVLTFEGIGDVVPVGNYYNGGAGPNYGVEFGSGYAFRDGLHSGGGNFQNEPSLVSALLYYDSSDPTITVAGGFTTLSFAYASSDDVDVVVYDETGTPLATVTAPVTGLCDSSQCKYQWGLWNHVTVPFRGVATSVQFTRNPDIVFIDDVTLTLVSPPPCTKTTYWLWNPTTDTAVRELVNNTASCISQPYNIEVRPCTSPTKLPVVIQLKNATDAPLKGNSEYNAPFFLWGDKTATSDVYPNKKPLPKGKYLLQSMIDGKTEKFTFTQTC